MTPVAKTRVHQNHLPSQLFPETIAVFIARRCADRRAQRFRAAGACR